MNNTSTNRLLVPGLGHLPLSFVLLLNSRFAHGFDEWSQIPAVTAREFAMVQVMNDLTDKPDWYLQVFDDCVAAVWRDEAFAMTELMSERTWEWCLAELRDKASRFKGKGYVRVLDTGSCVCKSDTLVAVSLGEKIRNSLEPLFEQRTSTGRRTQHGSVVNVVDPSLFPLTYGRSLVLANSNTVASDDPLNSYKDTEVAPKHFDERIDSDKIQTGVEDGRVEAWRSDFHYFSGKIRHYFWSYKFQWLPCEVEFIGKAGTDVRITSYVNNLHPSHKSLYGSLETLIGLVIPLWNDCLAKAHDEWPCDIDCNVENDLRQRGPVPMRIITFGVEWENELPEWALSFDLPLTARAARYREAQETVESTKNYTDAESTRKRLGALKRLDGMPDIKCRENMPEPTPELWRKAKEYLELPEPESTNPPIKVPEDWSIDPRQAWKLILRKHERLLRFRHPEPGTAFSYEEWKSGKDNHRAVIPVVAKRSKSHNFAPTDSTHEPYTIRLQDKFRERGLQVIIKISGIDLSSSQPRHAGTPWHLVGHMNEHIVGVAMYPFSISNITRPSISFRQETPINAYYYRYAWQRYRFDESFNPLQPPADHYGKHRHELAALAQILGFTEEDLARHTNPVHDPLPFQEIGSINLHQGRLITFPNLMEHRWNPFELLDKAQPGWCRWITMYLVDPNYRICSTANVPPQQKDWWCEAVVPILMELGLPREIAEQVIDETGEEWLMGRREAEECREGMEREHGWKEVARHCSMSLYGFE